MQSRERPDFRLVVITDAGQAAPRSVEDVVEAALQAGAPAIQLRMKGATARELFDAGLQLRPRVRDAGALFFVNDRLDVALALDADGVHLGPDDIPVSAARRAARVAGNDRLIIGSSTDQPERARALVAEGADYIGCGAVFGTVSKAEVGDERIGPKGLRAVVDAVPVPVVGIGGVTPHNVDDVAATGAAGAAVIGAVMKAEDIEATVRKLLEPFE